MTIYALVTGANQGIGKEAVRKLGDLGYVVFLGSRNKENGEKAVKELKDLNPKADIRLVELDVTKKDSIEKAVQTISSQTNGTLDVLVNNAGVLIEALAPSQSVQLEATFQTNFFGAVHTTNAFLPLLKKGVKKNIVNVSSEMGSLQLTNHPSSDQYNFDAYAYSASKVALNSFTVHLARELKNQGFRVNSIAPGYVSTSMTQNAGRLTVDEGTRVIIKYATIGVDGPTGGFYYDNGCVIPF